MLKRIFNHLYFTWLFIFQIFFLLPRFKNKYFLLIIFKHLVPLNPFSVTLLPGHTFQFLLGNLEAFTGQTKYKISPEGFGCALGSPPLWCCPERLQREEHRKHLNQMSESPHAAPFFPKKEERLYFKIPPDVRTPLSPLSVVLCKTIISWRF